MEPLTPGIEAAARPPARFVAECLARERPAIRQAYRAPDNAMEANHRPATKPIAETSAEPTAGKGGQAGHAPG